MDRKQVSVICASTNVKAVPRYNPEEVEDSSMIQRIINVEKILERHSARLDENYAHVADTKNEIEASTRNINNIQNEVQTSLKIANEAKECVDTNTKGVTDLISQINKGNKPTFAKLAGESRSNEQNAFSVGGSGSDDADDAGGRWNTAGKSRFNAQNVVNGGPGRPSSSASGGAARGSVQRNNTDRRQRADSNLHNRNVHNRSPYRYRTTIADGQVRGLGAPLPSRYVVLERVMNDRTKQDIHDYMERKSKKQTSQLGQLNLCPSLS